MATALRNELLINSPINDLLWNDAEYFTLSPSYFFAAEYEAREGSEKSSPSQASRTKGGYPALKLLRKRTQTSLNCVTISIKVGNSPIIVTGFK